MIVQFYSLYVGKTIRVFKVRLSVYLNDLLSFSIRFTCLSSLFMNQPVKVHIELMKMFVFENINFTEPPHKHQGKEKLDPKP